MDLFDKRASEMPVGKPSTVQAAKGDPWPLSIPWTMTGDPWPLSPARPTEGDPWPLFAAGVLQIRQSTNHGLQPGTARR